MSTPPVVSSHSGADMFDWEKVNFREVCSRSGPTYSFWGQKERTQRSHESDEVKVWLSKLFRATYLAAGSMDKAGDVSRASQEVWLVYWESAVLGRHKVPDFWENAAKLLSDPSFGPGHTLGERFSQIEEQLAAKWAIHSQGTLPHHGAAFLAECKFHEPETAPSHPDSEGSDTRSLRSVVTRLSSPRRLLSRGRIVDTQGESDGPAAGADKAPE